MSIIRTLAHFYEQYNKYHQEEPLLDERLKEQSIHFLIELRKNGEFLQLYDYREESKAKKSVQLHPKKVIVANEGGRTRDVGPCLFYDRPDYIFGKSVCKWLKGTEKKIEEKHQKFLEMLDNLPAKIKKDEAVKAVIKFYEKPGELEKVFRHPLWQECIDLMKDGIWLSFKLQNDAIPLTERRNLFEHYGQHIKQREEERRLKARKKKSKKEEPEEGFCPILGKKARVARLHPPIKLGKEQPPLISFNEAPSKSHGKEQGLNSPISEVAADRYAKAFNHLLTDEKHHWNVGDTHVLFWRSPRNNDQTLQIEQDFQDVGEYSSKELNQFSETAKLKRLFENCSLSCEGESKNEADTQTFYVLVLKKYKSRLAIQHWQEESLYALKKNFLQYFKDLKLGNNPSNSYISFRKLLESCLSSKEKEEQKKKDAFVQRHLPDLLRTALLGKPFPRVLQYAVLQRIKKNQGKIEHTQAALIKAFINRQARKNQLEEVIQVSLNKENSNIGYCLGRYLALVNDLEDSGKDRVTARFFNSLINFTQRALSDLDKLTICYENRLRRSQKEGKAKRLMKDIRQVVDLINPDDGVPQQLNRKERSYFVLGRHQQTLDLLQKTNQKKNQGESTDGEQ